MRKLFVVLIACIVAIPALASRPVTEQERAKIEDALRALGCSGGKLGFDDDKFEVDDAACVDARLYDFDLDRQYKVIRMKLD